MSMDAPQEPTPQPSGIQPFILVCQHDGERLTSVDLTRNATILFEESAERMFCQVSIEELLAAERCLRQAANRIDHWIAAKRYHQAAGAEPKTVRPPYPGPPQDRALSP